MSVTSYIVNAHDGALKTVEQIENLLDAMGLLKRRSVLGTLHADRVVESIKHDVEDAATDTGGDHG